MANKPPDVREGDRPSASGHNDVADAAFRELGGSAPGFSGPDGMAVRENEQFPEPYAKAQSDWEENSGDPKVSVKMCDADGENVRGPAFDVFLPRKRDEPVDQDPDVYEDDVIQWAFDYAGRRVCVSPYLTASTVRFKLKAALVADSTATAWVMPWDPDAGDYADPEDDEITVEDFADLGLVGPIDSKGKATRRPNASDVYEVTHLQPIASMITALTDGAVAAGDGTFAIDNTEIAFPPGAVYSTGSAPAVCNNVLGLPGLTNIRVVAFYNHEEDKWEGFPVMSTSECQYWEFSTGKAKFC